MSKKLRIGCLLCAIGALFACVLSGCNDAQTDSKQKDDSEKIETTTTVNEEWSEWMTALPSHVKQPEYEIESTLLFRSRKILTPAVESTVSWSEWSDNATTPTNAIERESRVVYSYKVSRVRDNNYTGTSSMNKYLYGVDLLFLKRCANYNYDTPILDYLRSYIVQSDLTKGWTKQQLVNKLNECPEYDFTYEETTIQSINGALSADAEDDVVREPNTGELWGYADMVLMSQGSQYRYKIKTEAVPATYSAWSDYTVTMMVSDATTDVESCIHYRYRKNNAENNANNNVINNGNNANGGQNNGNQNNNSGNGSIKTLPLPSQIEAALQGQNYFWMRDYEAESDLEDMPSGVVKLYRYGAARFYNEYGTVYPYSQSVSVESLMDSDYYESLEAIDIIYVQFDSASSAHNAFVELLEDDVIEGNYNTGSGSNWERAWQYFSVGTLNVLVCRIDNVVCVIYAEWDDFDDAGIAYDNAAIKAMEQIGF